MSILYCQKTIFPNASAHALHTGNTAAHFAEKGASTFFFPAVPLLGGRKCLEVFFNNLGFSQLPGLLKTIATPIRQKGLYSLMFRYHLLRIMYGEKNPLCFASSVKETILALQTRSLLPHKRKIPIVFEIHHLISKLKEGKTADRLYALETRAFREADLIVFNCESLMNQAKNYLPSPKKAIVAPLGFNEKVITPISRLQNPIEQEKPAVNLAYVGSFQKGKGVENLLHAMSLLPNEYTLKIIGGRPKNALQELQKLSDRLGLSNRVTFRGQITQCKVASQLADTDIFVIPLETDTDFLAPMKMFEAVGFALPIVATPMPSLKQQLVDGRNALFTSGTTPPMLANTILKLGNSFNLRMNMHHANIELAKQLSSAARTKKLLEHFQAFFGESVLH